MVGSASASLVSRPAQRSLALQPVWSLNRPRRPFVVGVLRPMSLPPSSAPTATGWSDSCRAGFAPAEERRLVTAHHTPPLSDPRAFPREPSWYAPGPFGRLGLRCSHASVGVLAPAPEHLATCSAPLATRKTLQPTATRKGDRAHSRERRPAPICRAAGPSRRLNLTGAPGLRRPRFRKPVAVSCDSRFDHYRLFLPPRKHQCHSRLLERRLRPCSGGPIAARRRKRWRSP